MEIDRCFDAAQLHGFDVNEHLESEFPRRPNLHFWTSSLQQVSGSFDLISISGSLVYVADIFGLMAAVERLLKPDGVVFVQSVDIAQSPYAILLGDQRYHYSQRTLGHMFSHYGFRFTAMDNSWAPREVIGCARRHFPRGTETFVEDRHVFGCVVYLDDMVERLRGLSMTVDGPIGVLGTSAAAAFVDSVLDVSFYADENPGRRGGNFEASRCCTPDRWTLQPWYYSRMAT